MTLCPKFQWLHSFKATMTTKGFASRVKQLYRVKSERERQILYINAYIWNLERWYQQSYMQRSKTDIDLKNRLLDMVGEGESGMISENSIEIYTLIITLYAKQKKRHRCIEQSFGLCGRRRRWDVSREQHRNTYII